MCFSIGRIIYKNTIDLLLFLFIRLLFSAVFVKKILLYSLLRFLIFLGLRVRVLSSIRILRLRSLYSRKFLYLRRVDSSFNTRDLIFHAIIFFPNKIEGEISLNLKSKTTYKIENALLLTKRDEILFQFF